MTRDMIKILKSCFFKKQFFTFNFSKKCKNWHFLKKQFFSFLIISPVIFDLQKRTIPQIKALNILFWPYFIHFIARMDIWWAMKPRKCPVFCSSDFMWKIRFFEVLHVDIAQKLQILKILTIFSNFSVEFQFSLSFGGVMEKNSEKGSNELELKALFKETWFLG